MATLSIGEYLLESVSDIELSKSREIFEEPGKRGGDKTVTISVISTPESNKAFEYYFSANTELLTFDPRKKQDAILYFNNTPYFEGIAKLVGVTKDMEYTTYKVVIFGNLIDFFGEIDNKLLKEVDLSEYDHNYLADNIKASFENDVFKNGTLQSVPQGEGYRYPNADYGNYYHFDPVPDLRPAYYVNEILKKIIADSGYRYTGGFIDSDELKDVAILSSGNWKLTDTQVKSLSVAAERPSSFTDVQTQNFSPISFATVLSDPSSQWSTGTFTADQNLEVTVKGFISARLQLRLNPFGIGNNNWIHGHLSLLRRRGGVVTTLSTIKMPPVEVTANSTLSPNTFTDIIDFNYDFGEHRIEGTDELGIIFTGAERANEDYSFIPSQPPSSWNIEVRQGSTISIVPTGTIVAGTEIGFANTIDRNVKQSDFVKWIFNKYNVVLDYDKNDPYLLIIKTFDSYYSSDLVELKIDRSHTVEITPVPDELSGRYYLSDKKGGDVLSERYFGRWGQNHGSKIVLTENDFFRGQKEITTGFEPAVMFRPDNDDKTVVSLRKPEGGDDPASGIKIGYIKTDLDCILYRITDGWLTTSTDKWVYMGFIDDPVTPARDLSFGVPESYYHVGVENTFVATNNTAHNRFWRKRILRNQNPNTRVMNCHVLMNMVKYDLSTFDKLFYVDNAYWRLLQIEKFNPNRGGVTKVKLISEVPIEDFVGDTETIGGGSGEFPDGEEYPDTDVLPEEPDGWVINGGKKGINPEGVIVGTGEATGGVQIYSGVGVAEYGGTLISSPNSYAKAGDVFIGDIQQSKLLEIELDSSDILDLFTNPIEIPFFVQDNEVIEVTKVTGIIGGGTTDYTGGTIVVRYELGGDIAAFSSGFAGFEEGIEIPSINTIPETGKPLEIGATAAISTGDRIIKLKIEYKIWQI